MQTVHGTTRVNVEYNLTPEDLLHCFAQWRELNPNERLDTFNPRRYLNAVREVLALKGTAAITCKLPDSVEIKKMDYKAELKGILDRSSRY
jgi:hypothetical protein